MGSWFSDMRYAARRLTKTPAFTITALFTVALAIGANTAIYSVVDALMIRPLPYRDPAGLAELTVQERDGLLDTYFKPDQLADWRQSGALAQLEGYANRTGTAVGDGEPETLLGAALTGGTMDMLGVRPALGRLLSEADATPGHDRVLVLSDALWRRRFGSDPKILGKILRLDDQSFEIVGVMPHDFNYPYGRRQFWVPLALDTRAGTAGARISLALIGRLRTDVSTSEAGSRLAATVARLVAEKRIPAGAVARLGPLTATHLNPPIKRALYVLSAAVVLVLLIACANVANLLLIQGGARRREITVRMALGASRPRVIRQLLAETLVVAGAGGAAGVLLAQWAIDLLAAYTPKAMTFLTIYDIALNRRVLAFAAITTVATALAFGLLPALRTASRHPLAGLGDEDRATTGGPRAEWLRRTFVFAQLALSLVLLIGAGLLMRTFVRVARQDVGFDPRNLIAAQISLPRFRYADGPARARFDAALLAHVRATPGVVRASIEGGIPPIAGGIEFAIKPEVEGRGVVINDPHLILPFTEVGDDYFDLMRIAVRRGRTFGPQDTAHSPRVTLLSESMAARLFGAGDPLGHRVRLDADAPWLTVVGVVGDVYEFSHERVHDRFCLYYPRSQSALTAGYRTLVVRAAGSVSSPAPVIALLKRAVWEVDPAQPIQTIETLDAAYAEFLAVPRFYAWLMGTFALIGVVIASVGLYGVLSYATAQRTREFGIRIALGASSRDVLGLVMRSGVALTVGGIAAGVVGSLLVTRALQSILVDVSRIDAPTYAGVVTLLAGIAITATWIPAARAARTDPAVTLRQN